VVIDAHGAELTEDVLPEQAVKLQFENALEFLKIHHGDRVRKPHTLAENQIGGAAHGISGHADTIRPARILRNGEFVVAVRFGANNRTIGARIEQKRRTITVHFTFYKDHGLHGAERHLEGGGAGAIGKGNHEKEEERQDTAKVFRPNGGTMSCEHTAVSVQNGARGPGTRVGFVDENCAQMKLPAKFG
jgi:hypothetical protein